LEVAREIFVLQGTQKTQKDQISVSTLAMKMMATMMEEIVPVTGYE
jgi:hypothetical protein